MAGKGGVRSTTWKPGQNPVKRKGQKHRTTRIKEAIGLSGWEALAEFLRTEGADVFLRKMQALSPKDYIGAYCQMLEFVKPKLSRVEAKAEIETSTAPSWVVVDIPSDMFSVDELRLISRGHFSELSPDAALKLLSFTTDTDH